MKIKFLYKDQEFYYKESFSASGLYTYIHVYKRNTNKYSFWFKPYVKIYTKQYFLEKASPQNLKEIMDYLYSRGEVIEPMKLK